MISPSTPKVKDTMHYIWTLIMTEHSECLIHDLFELSNKKWLQLNNAEKKATWQIVWLADRLDYYSVLSIFVMWCLLPPSNIHPAVTSSLLSRFSQSLFHVFFGMLSSLLTIRVQRTSIFFFFSISPKVPASCQLFSVCALLNGSSQKYTCRVLKLF